MIFFLNGFVKIDIVARPVPQPKCIRNVHQSLKSVDFPCSNGRKCVSCKQVIDSCIAPYIVVALKKPNPITYILSYGPILIYNDFLDYLI